MQYDRIEFPAGEDQLIVVYVNQDTAESIDVTTFFNEIASEAAAKRELGWRLRSIASMPMRQMGTAGNIMFQSGGQYATQVALVVVFTADQPPS
jgi:hypothetical protein